MSVIGDILGVIAPRRRTRVYDKNSISGLGTYIEQYTVPVGAIISKFTNTDPGDGWLLVSGQTLNKEDYPQLYAEIGALFGETTLTFNLPDLADTYMTGVGVLAVGAVGGANDLTLTVAQLPAHNHGITDPGHDHTFTGTPHDHTFTGDPHDHDITDAGHTHTSGQPDSNGTTGADAVGASSGATSSDTTGITIDAETATGTVGSETAGGSLSTDITGITISNTGSGDTIDNRPKSIALFYFIKVAT